MPVGDFIQRYKQLAPMVRPWAPAWNQSVLHNWPACRDALTQDWWESLVDWPLERIHVLDDGIAGVQEIPRDWDVPPDLRAFLDATRPWLHFPRSPAATALPESKTWRMTVKKQHEIAAILPFLAQQKNELGIDRAVDIGGGVGHLARTVTTELQLPMVTIDRDAALQAEGRWLLHKLGATETPLHFVEGELQSESQPMLDAYFAGSCLSLGLHTCGPLAWAHLKKSQPSRGLLNFGCCYDRMDVERDCEQSEGARQSPLPWTSFALFLATRGRRRTLQELQLQERVNTWRLALHLFLQEEGLAEGFVTVGDAPRAVYARSFQDYAEDRIRSMKMNFAPHRDRAACFLARTDVQRSMREFFLLNVVRNAFSRPLEVLLLLDRALWLEEKGHKVEIQQFFDPSLSPRNLGIFAVLKNA